METRIFTSGNNHEQAERLARLLCPPSEIWTTEAVLIEIGNALSELNRVGAIEFIQSCYVTENIYIHSVDDALLQRAVELPTVTVVVPRHRTLDRGTPEVSFNKLALPSGSFTLSYSKTYSSSPLAFRLARSRASRSRSSGSS